MWVAFTIALAQSTPLDAVVFVEQGSSACAGTVIDDVGTVLTAYHCVVSGGRPRVRTRDGRQGIGRVRGVDRARDLALIDVPFLAASASLPVRDQAPEPGQPVRAVGHPLGAAVPAGFFEGTLRWSIAAGGVSAVGTRAVQISAPVNPGNSGGPVLDAQDGIVGVVSRKLGGDGLGFAGRVDGVAELGALPVRRLSPFGGTVALEVMVQANGDLATPLGVGGRLEVALRDRVVFAGSVATPIGARWEAAQLGAVIHEPYEGRAAVRQRFGRGPWTVRADAWVAVGALETVQVGDDLRVRRDTEVASLVGGRLGIRGVGIDYGIALGEHSFSRMQITFRWPGTLFIM